MVDVLTKILDSWQVVAVAIMIYLYWKKRDWLRVDGEFVSRAGFYLMLLFMVRLAIFSTPGSNLTLPPQIFPLGMIFVFLEDMFFLALPSLLTSWTNRTINKIAIWTGFALFFAHGHLYQGPMGAVAALFFLYFGHKIGRKHGFGTTSLIHIFYDLSTVFAVKIAYALTLIK